MDLVVKNPLSGARYRLLFHPASTRPRLSTPPTQQTLPLKQADAVFANASPESPPAWSFLWDKLKPVGQKPLSQKAEVVAAIKSLMGEGRVQLLPLLETPAVTPDLPSRNKGSSGGTRAHSVATEEPAVIARSAASVTPESTGRPYADAQAVQSDAPADANDQALDNTRCEGDPVSMITGEETLQHTDFTLPGPMPFAWVRTYRSSHARDIGLGAAWSHSGSEYLELHQEKLSYVDSEGRSLPFHIPAIKQRSKYLPEGLTLDRVTENLFILRQEGQWDKVFSRATHTLKRCQLTELRHPAYTSPGHPRGEQGFCLRFHYNASHQLSRIQGNWGKSFIIARNRDGRIESLRLRNDVLNQEKHVASYEYNADGDLIAHRNAKGVGEQYRYRNHLIEQRTLVTGFHFYFDWDGDDHTARCTHNWGERGIYEYYFDWDPANRCSKATDSRGFQRQYHYNDYGQIIKEVDNEGGVHHTRYDQGRKCAYTDPEGHTTQYYVNEEHQPAGLRDPLGHDLTIDYFRGRATTFIDKDKARWRREYNRQGQLIELINPAGQSTRYSYCAQGLIRSIIDSSQRITRFHWNAQGELAQRIDPQGYAQQFHYDAWGQVVAVDGLVNGKVTGTTRYDYTATGAISKVIAPNGDTRSYTYNDNDQLTHYSDPQGRVTEFAYDGLSQVVERIDAEGQRLRYEYDSERNLTALINEKGERYQFFYDGNERLIKEIGFDGRTQHYHYNKAGHLIKHLDAGEVMTEFERDALGQMLSKTSQAIGAKNEQTMRTRFAYDAKGRLIESYNAHQYLAFEYNVLGTLRKEHHSDLNAKMARIKASMVDIDYHHNAFGLPTGLQLPDGQRIDYHYNAQQHLTNIAFNGERLTQIERDAFGREIARHQGALTTESHYDPMGRLQYQRSVHRDNKAQGPIQREYGYNAFGNLSQFTDGEISTGYVYDQLNRLEKVTGDQPERFTFDPASNLLSTDDSPLANSDGNRLQFHGDCKFTYDARGNVIRENRGKDGKRETSYHYNLNNQLIKVEKAGQTTEYQYDPLGRRIKKHDAFGATRYLWAGDQMVQEQREQLKKTYLYEPQSFRPVAMVQDDHIYHYHLDHLGTPREMTNDDGHVVWKVRYKTYGNVALKDVEEVENNLRFQGQYFDEETGLHYNRHRYYNPSTGQFTTQDPIGLLGGVNNYQYAPNPVSWIDPLGLTCKELNTWNAFQADHKGQFSNVSEASKAYKELKEQQSPWPIGYDHTSHVRTMDIGETFSMIVDAGKENMPGRFATFDAITSPEYGREQLAIKAEWKPTLDNVVTYRVKKPFDVYEGPVGPQIDGKTYLTGGGTQITFKEDDVWSNARPNKYNKKTKDPYLEVVSIKPLPPES